MPAFRLAIGPEFRQSPEHRHFRAFFADFTYLVKVRDDLVEQSDAFDSICDLLDKQTNRGILGLQI